MSTRLESAHEDIRKDRDAYHFAKRISPASATSRVFIWITVARLCLIPPLVVASTATLKLATLAIFILWDIYDGKLARRWTVDFPFRRMVDAYVDRIMINAVSISLLCFAPALLPIVGALILRDVLLWILLHRKFVKHGLCILGGQPNRQSAWVWAFFASSYWIQGNTWISQCLGAAAVLSSVAVLVSTWYCGRGAVASPPRVMLHRRWFTTFS